MKYIIAAIVTLSAGSAWATCTTQTIGNTTYTNCSNGYRATQQQVGGINYGRDNEDHQWTQQDIGGTVYTNEY